MDTNSDLEIIEHILKTNCTVTFSGYVKEKDGHGGGYIHGGYMMTIENSKEEVILSRKSCDVFLLIKQAIEALGPKVIH